MEVKSKRVRLSRADRYIETQEAFGWEVVSKDDMRPDNTIVITMERRKENFSDYRAVVALEKQYYSLNRPYPILAIIFALIGAGCLVAFFFLKGVFAFYFTLLYLALTFFCIATFALIVFLILLLQRGKLVDAIKERAANQSGANRDWPTPRNVIPEEEGTWNLYENNK